jgi:hypothetical protein
MAKEVSENWHIEFGNDAELVRTVVFFGTSHAAVRKAKSELRRAEPGEDCADIRRPGCRVYRSVTLGK